MSRRSILSLSTAAAFLASSYLYYQHTRLSNLYPTFSVPSVLNPRNRSDRPFTTDQWARSDVANLWYFRVPRKTLEAKLSSQTQSRKDGEAGELWARAFWGSWPLRLENGIIGLVTKLGMGIVSPPREGSRGEKFDEDGRWNGYQKGTRLVNGGFTVEAVDISSSKPRHISRWGSVTPSPSAPFFIVGGYHTLTILPTSALPSTSLPPSTEVSTDDVLLVFISHAVHRTPISLQTNAQGEEELLSELDQLPNLDWKDRLLGKFHEEYSRILIDLAVRRMGL
ncbi:hypothetical protein CI109_107345 [Kwoniella shandongensis]|uniref:Uncharacterized protein n=1 Tax=Kwoniella shandongensis TaxID=1734106 RepID=A0A5M6BXQ2_9TREE|nr:uncharacterized protein CI109_004727 [Kwoniella shandongensis]KAA5526950.1 hypothetical protein CI109_004727 [Kwoniella shandongensis]